MKPVSLLLLVVSLLLLSFSLYPQNPEWINYTNHQNLTSGDDYSFKIVSIY